MKNLYLLFIISVILVFSNNCFAQKTLNSKLKMTSQNELLAKSVKNHHWEFNHNLQNSKSTSDKTNGPVLNWLTMISGNGQAYTSDLAVDSQNNIYITGNFSSSISMNNLTKTTQGLWSFFVIKTDSSGKLIWFQAANTNKNKRMLSYALSVDNSGNVFVCGTLDAENAEIGGQVLSAFQDEAFLIKLTYTGACEWANIFPTVTEAVDVKTDVDGNAYIGCNSSQASLLFKAGSDGTIIWQKNILNIYLEKIAISDASIYFSGEVYGSANIDNVLLRSNYDEVPYIVKCTLDGKVTWGISASTGGRFSSANDLAIDKSGNIYFTGYYQDSIRIDKNQVSLDLLNHSVSNYLCKINPSGKVQWLSNWVSDYLSTSKVFIDYQNKPNLLGYTYASINFGSDSIIGDGSFYRLKFDTGGIAMTAIKIDSAFHVIKLSQSGREIKAFSDSIGIKIVKTNSSGNNEVSMNIVSDLGNSSIWYQLDADKKGNTYIHGFINGTCNFGDKKITVNGAYIGCLDITGTTKWVKLIESNGIISPSGIVLDTLGNSYSWGTFRGNFKVEGFHFEMSDHDGAYLIKCNKEGVLLWSKQFASSSNIIGTGGITISEYLNPVIIGNFTDTLTINGTQYFGNGSQDIFISKFDTEGKIIFVKCIGGTGLNYGRSIVADKSSNLYFTGSFTKSITYGSKTLTSNGLGNIFIAKLSSTGSQEWIKSAGGTSLDRAFSIDRDQNNNLYISGFLNSSQGYFGNINFYSNTGNTYLFLAKYGSDGSEKWVRIFQCSSAAWPVYKISTDSKGNCYMGGSSFGSVTSETDSLLLPVGSNDFFIAKYNSDGLLKWIKSFGTINASGNLFSIKAVAEDVVIAGGFINSWGIFDNDTTNSSAESAFIAMFGNYSGIPDIIGNNEFKISGSFDIFPNPATDLINVKFNDNYIGNISIEIFDITGRQVFNRDIIKVTNEFSDNFNLAMLKSGLYNVKVTTGANSFAKKIIIK